MIVEITLKQEDWKQFQASLCKELSQSRRTFFDGLGFNVVLWFVLAFLFLNVFERIGEMHWPSFSAAALIAGAIGGYAIFQSARTRRALRPSESGSFVGHHTYEITQSGIAAKGRGYRSFFSWDIVQSVRRSNGQILVFIDSAAALIFPEDRLDNPSSFYAYLVELHGET